MESLICLIVFVLCIIISILLFAHYNMRKNRLHSNLNHQKIHFKLSVYKSTYVEFDYTLDYDADKTRKKGRG